MRYDAELLVIGAGHAGVEAATAAARMGVRTTLLTGNLDTIARMSCNPAIGGVGKGHLVREIDALGGVMGRAIDANGIQFRMLNRSKGPAMHGPRAQADRREYAIWVKNECECTPNLTLREEQVIEVLVESIHSATNDTNALNDTVINTTGPSTQTLHIPRNRVTGVRTRNGSIYSASKVILCTGTFLHGVLHYGDVRMPGGRSGDEPAEGISDSLRRAGIQLERFKTGTPMRINMRSVDLSRFEEHGGDNPPEPFSFMNDRIDAPQIPCWIAWTNEQVHQIIMDNLNRAPMYTGQILSTGPRYCPSIETKVVRFREKTRHQVFLEPEGRRTQELYVNGISTSLPCDVQIAMVHAIPGMERAELLRFGYAIEYDYAPPQQLWATLETKAVQGLYLAGQLNGTTGYEEAGALGLIAGMNAALALNDKSPLVLNRDQAYMGVMIDDLITRGVDEPYRMFTSRAEHRLRLRQDNADRRLTPLGKELGVVEASRWTKFQQKEVEIQHVQTLLRTRRYEGASLEEISRRPEATAEQLMEICPELRTATPRVMDSILIDAKYAGYIERENREVAAMEKHGKMQLPHEIDYRTIQHLRSEACEKLNRVHPWNFAQALRIPGITPADLMVVRIGLEHLQQES